MTRKRRPPLDARQAAEYVGLTYENFRSQMRFARQRGEASCHAPQATWKFQRWPMYDPDLLDQWKTGRRRSRTEEPTP